MLEKWLLSVGAVTLSFVWGAGFVWAQGGFAPSIDTTVVAQPTAPVVRPRPSGFGNATPLPSPSPSPVATRPTPTRTRVPATAVVPQQNPGTSGSSAADLAGTAARVAES